MTDYTIAIYCFIDDFLKKIGRKENHLKKITDAELMTTALVAGRYFSGNHQKAMNYMKDHQGVNMIDKSGFNRRLHGLSTQLNAIFIGLGNTLKRLNTESVYLIDSFPVRGCRNIRIPRNKILKQEIYRGKSASKREYFYGFKVQVITTKEGIPVDYFISAGSFADITAFQAMHIDLPEGSQLYVDYGLEDFYKECEDIQLFIERKSNSKRKDSPALAFIKKQLRKRVETTFSEITAFFPLKIHAVTPEGFLLKIFLFFFAYTLKRVVA
ncbi:IS982 family transposase [Microscilla marina]|uniref:Transposase, IS4 n=1 Tax=Microscilla marina ATCC 23134 TaxID=313606 RepID=A1ZSG8_MICM2|nr:IS982 family transposase [Microscilla marina]EAY26716.1 transposase, IS4 [Microscilla marina ATCC 23134]